MRRKLLKSMQNSCQPLISVVLLNQNGLEYLRKTIGPLLALRYSNIEFIVIDNGSTDGSREFLREFKNITLIELACNIGYSAGKNVGVDKANGDYILLLDNDILICDDFNLEKMIAVCESDSAFVQVPLVDLYKTKTSYYGLFFSCYGANSHKKEVDVDVILGSVRKKYDIGGCTGGCIFFKRDWWSQIGGFDESQLFNIDDVDLGPRIWMFEHKAVLFTEWVFVHIGVGKTRSAEEYAYRLKTLFSGHARSMVKNYQGHHLMVHLPLLFLFQMVKSVKYSFKKKDLKIFMSFWSSVGLFLVRLRNTLSERRRIQLGRILKRDVFLEIAPPKFL